MSFTDQQKRIIAILPRVTAALSILGSSFIIYQVLKNPKKREMVYHRQMLILSCTDFIYSAVWFVGSWPPSGSVWCTSNAFLGLLTGVPQAMFNAALCLYYLFTIRYKWSEVQMRRLQPLLLVFPIVWGLFNAIFPLSAGMINPGVNGVCWLVKTPSGCSGTDCIPAEKYYDLFNPIALHFPLWISFAVALVSMFFVYVTVSKDAQNDSADKAPVGFLWFAQREAGQDGSGRTRSRRMARQAFWYLVNFFMTYVFSTVIVILRMSGSDVPFALLSLYYLFSPIQGFGNAIIYMRPRYLRNREKNPEMSHWQAIFAEDEYDHRLGARAMRSTMRGQGRQSFLGSFFFSFREKSKSETGVMAPADSNKDISNEPDVEAKLGSLNEEEKQEEA
mmetsp:Transcript_8039/g.12208  ORF Transcript_8039/g.12208 Transcript_8039/m.12208 type:complete len:390 (+) Transcript_8039:205-1374(+)|eukprot:scaffold1062_cov98-Skeletonema_dohrnii-CCMP3373.AAC.6